MHSPRPCVRPKARRSLAIGGLVLLALGAGRLLPVGGVPFFGCWFHRLTGLPCPGCGTTRAIAALSRGDFAGGFALNPLAAVLAAVLGGTGVYLLVVGARGRPAAAARRPAPRVGPRMRVLGALLGAAVLLAHWAWLIHAGR